MHPDSELHQAGLWQKRQRRMTQPPSTEAHQENAHQNDPFRIRETD